MLRRDAWRRLALPVALGALVFVYAIGILDISAQFSEGGTGPKTMPTILVLIAAICVVAVCVQECRANTRQTSPGEVSSDQGEPVNELRPMLLIGSVMATIALFKPAGALVSIFLLAWSLLWLFDFAVGAPLKRAVAAVAVTAACYALFALAFGARLPLLPEML